MTLLAHDTHNNPTLQSKLLQEEAAASAGGGGRVQSPHLTQRQPEGQRDWAMKMKDGSTNGGAAMVGTEERVEVDEGKTLTAEWA